MAGQWYKHQNVKLLIVAVIFLLVFFIPFSHPKVSSASQEALLMLQEYAREHVLLCLVPAFFIAGAIMVFMNQQAVIRYLGPKAKKITAYSVASVSGVILAVCSCSVLPLFKGIYKKGAGIGPAISFLYSGPAINILAIALTAKVLGWQLGIARAIGAVAFAFIIGLLMHLIFRKDDRTRVTDDTMFQSFEGDGRPLWQNLIYLFSMIGILVFINWTPSIGTMVVWDVIYNLKYIVTGGFALILLFILIKWFKKDELISWVAATRDFALQILPLLFGGVLIAGFLFGRPGHATLIPEASIAGLVGSNSIIANIIASFSGALMYFATLTEVPIMQGLIGAGMAKGPALALLLAGPSLSLPSMMVIAGELGLKKTLVYIGLVVIMSALAGIIYGIIPNI
jgi:uncharacterized membrane protein YraQ (UPF0718 family)